MSESTTSKTNYGALTILTTVFFFWGFIAAGNSVFIPFCKSYFGLDQFQSQLIDFAFYGAYYLGALALFVFGSSTGRDLVGSWGYKKSIVYGLLLSTLGAGAMIISVYLNVFSGMLFGLFIVALGFSIQQTSANPFMVSIGDEATGSSRINLGGGINSLGTTLGPLIVSLALFGTTASLTPEMIQSLSLSKVMILYGCVGGLFLGIAALFGFSKKVPDGKIRADKEKKEQGLIDQDVLQKSESSKNAMVTLLVVTGLLITCFVPVFSSYRSVEVESIEKIENKMATLDEVTDVEQIAMFQLEIDQIKVPLENKRMAWLSGGLLVILGGLLFAYSKGKKEKIGWGAMQYPQVTLGMLAIFVYVGVEVTVGSNISELLKQKEFGGLGSSEIAPYVAMFWGSLMIGRWTGAISVFKMSNMMKQVLRFVVPLVAFSVVLLASWLYGYDVQPLYWYIVCVLIQIAAFYITDDKPTLTLSVFGALGVFAIVVGLITTGIVAVYAFLAAGLCCSIMWPCIFSLSIAGTGKYQTQASAFLVMMILGGAIIPPLQGKLADVIGIQPSFVVGAACFAYLAFFALYVRKILNKQGVKMT
ncbi:MAG: MFS transporter [Crocinitomicaceae bacterium]|nr:MFS transporter [Crocinitomicaceae bacterium]